MTDLTPTTDPFSQAAERKQVRDRKILDRLQTSRTAMEMALSVAHREIFSANTLHRPAGEVLDRWAGTLHLLDGKHLSLDATVSDVTAALREWHYPL